jgi:ribosome-associated translation inhibitor RaiA
LNRFREANAVGDSKLVIHFKGIEHDEELQQHLERRCEHLATEFHETDRYELSLSPERNEISAHAKVTGKNTSTASHASAPEARQAAETALDRLERELRKDHDKRIFKPRREAKRAQTKRTS